MFITKNSGSSTNLIDQAVHSADVAIEATQQMATDAVEGLAHSVEAARQQLVPAINSAGHAANALMQQGVEIVREAPHQVELAVRQASNKTVAYIREEPVKAVLIAAATGAAIVSLARVIGQSSHPR